MGYGNFPFVITENQSQIPPWESLVKVKNKLKKHSCLRHSCFLNLFFLSLVTLRQEFDSDFLWSLMGNFHTPSRHPLGNTTLLYNVWKFTTVQHYLEFSFQFCYLEFSFQFCFLRLLLWWCVRSKVMQASLFSSPQASWAHKFWTLFASFFVNPLFNFLSNRRHPISHTTSLLHTRTPLIYKRTSGISALRASIPFVRIKPSLY